MWEQGAYSHYVGGWGAAVWTGQLEEQYRRQSSVWDGLTTSWCGGRGMDQMASLIHQLIPIPHSLEDKGTRKEQGRDSVKLCLCPPTVQFINNHWSSIRHSIRHEDYTDEWGLNLSSKSTTCWKCVTPSPIRAWGFLDILTRRLPWSSSVIYFSCLLELWCAC